MRPTSIRITNFDQAATSSPKPTCVVEAVAQALATLGSAARGVHAGSLAADRTLYAVRRSLAQRYGVGDPRRVVLTQHATEALNIAIAGLPSPGDHVITTDAEHNAVLRPLHRAQRHGVEVSFVPLDVRGYPCWERLASLRRPQTRYLVVGHASNVTGYVVDLAPLAAWCRAHDIGLIVDAAQTAGLYPIDIDALGVHAVAVTGHKSLHGPPGTGALLLGAGVVPRPWLWGGTGTHTFEEEMPTALPAHLEAGTANAPAFAGLLAALDYLDTQPDTLSQALARMRQCYAGLADLDGIRWYGADVGEERRTPVLACNFGDVDAAQVANRLAIQYGIATRAGGHCAPRLHRHFGTEAQGILRLSFSHQHTAADVEYLVEALRAVWTSMDAKGGVGY